MDNGRHFSITLCVVVSDARQGSNRRDAPALWYSGQNTGSQPNVAIFLHGGFLSTRLLRIGDWGRTCSL